MSVEVSTAPIGDPIPIDRARDHLRITGSDYDVEIRLVLAAVTKHIENLMGRALITQTLKLRRDQWPADGEDLQLPMPPAQSVSSITYTDTSGVVQTLSADDYDVDIYSTPARIRPAWGESWPSIRPVPNAITVTYVAGYGNSPDDVPENIRQAILVALATAYEYREAIAEGDLNCLSGPATFAGFLSDERVYDFAEDDGEVP